MLVLASMAFLIFALPVVTLPAAFAALFAAVEPLVRPVSGDPLGRFWRGFRRSLGPGTLLGALNLLIGIILMMDIQFFLSLGSQAGRLAAGLCGSIAALVALVNVFAWPLLAWFPQPLGKLLRRSFLLVAVHPFLAIGGLFGASLSIALLLLLPGALQGAAVALGPGVFAAIIGVAAWQAMKRYAKPDDELTE